ncbi:MAG TPA: flagellar hook capping FlgD N-terminal domain-containing protein [Thermoguttaceae bacterium]|nr:flagellar hook capping FlgD N-terminal domain-containing protein [Thermoguttaceae bacterium]
MSTSATTGVMGQQGQQNTTGVDPWGNLDLDQFVQLLVTELQNQDPMEPMNNQEILNQISQIREIESNQRLTDTLESVLLGQNLVTAGNMLGQVVMGLTDGGDRVSGAVDRVSIEGGVAKIHVGEQKLDLKNVSEILPTDADLENIVDGLTGET